METHTEEIDITIDTSKEATTYEDLLLALIIYSIGFIFHVPPFNALLLSLMFLSVLFGMMLSIRRPKKTRVWKILSLVAVIVGLVVISIHLSLVQENLTKILEASYRSPINY